MKVKLDQELYMTEYMAIHIVLTLQSLYIYRLGLQDGGHRLETQPTTKTL